MIRSYRFAGRHWLLPALAFVLLQCTVAHAQNADWTGRWQTFWRDGQAVMELEQSGSQVRGGYEPGEGIVEGVVEGPLLKGTWREGDDSGEFVFALAHKGQSFTGRFGSGEYWNGKRLVDGFKAAIPFKLQTTPQQALTKLMAAFNAVDAGSTSASLNFLPLLDYAGPEENQNQLRRRRSLFKQLLNMTTFRLRNAPKNKKGRKAKFAVGRPGSGWSFPIDFIRRETGVWRVVVPSSQELQKNIDAGLEALGYSTYNAFYRAAENSPRQTMADLLFGLRDWQGGGRQLALDTLDLSRVPEQLRAIEGPLAAEYLRQIIDRVGYVILNEIPNDPKSVEPYTHFTHAGGAIVVAPVKRPDETVEWLFTADTIEALPDIYQAIQNLPAAFELSSAGHVSDYFHLRSLMQQASPNLLERKFWLENWQWVGLFVLVASALGLAAALSVLVKRLTRRLAPASGVSRKEIRAAGASLVWPVRLSVCGAVFLFGMGNLGLRQDFSAAMGTTASLMIVAGATFLMYALVSILGTWFPREDAATSTYNSMMTSMTAGIVKIGIILFGLIATAEVIDLPYEGAIAGLGIGGLALAIAARDTVSNFIGAAILLSDRPFKRGDLIELGTLMATVEDVGLRSTRLRTLDDSQLIIPNSKFVNEVVNNLGRRRSRRVILQIQVTYDTPRDRLDAFVDRLRDTYHEQPISTPELYLGLQAFGESSIDIRLWGYFQAQDLEDFIAAQHALIGDVVDLAKELDISFAFPTRTLHITETASFENTPPEVKKPE